MKRNEVIVDADFCIKIGSSSKYRYLEKLLPELAEVVYIHKTVYEEILYPSCVREQIDSLKKQGIMVLLDENELLPIEKRIYDSTYQLLFKAMADPRNRRKNRGEMASLAMAKTKEIPYFATDEMDLQNIVDSLLNAGVGKRICCIRIEAVIKEMKNGEIDFFKRKEAKVLWVLAGKRKEDFDTQIWPIDN